MGWFKRDKNVEVFNKQYRGSWSLILAITSKGDYFGVVVSERIDLKIFIFFGRVWSLAIFKETYDTR